MRFVLYEDKIVPVDRGGDELAETTWVEAGPYEIIRLMGDGKVLVEIPATGPTRYLTVLRLKDGELIK